MSEEIFSRVHTQYKEDVVALKTQAKNKFDGIVKCILVNSHRVLFFIHNLRVDSGSLRKSGAGRRGNAFFHLITSRTSNAG